MTAEEIGKLIPKDSLCHLCRERHFLKEPYETLCSWCTKGPDGAFQPDPSVAGLNEAELLYWHDYCMNKMPGNEYNELFNERF